MDENFSFAKLFNLTDPVGLSPFISLDAKRAFLLFQLNKSGPTLVKGMGALGVIGSFLVTRVPIIHKENLSSYEEEYLPRGLSVSVEGNGFNQALVFGENDIDHEIWNALPVGGVYILGGSKIKNSLSAQSFESLGHLWPLGQSTEFGWEFNKIELGLDNFEFLKLRKLKMP